MRNKTISQLAARVRQLRHKKRLTQEQVADGSGLHVTYVASIEGGKRNPSLRSLVALAKGLQTTVSELLEGVGGA